MKPVENDCWIKPGMFIKLCNGQSQRMRSGRMAYDWAIYVEVRTVRPDGVIIFKDYSTVDEFTTSMSWELRPEMPGRE